MTLTLNRTSNPNPDPDPDPDPDQVSVGTNCQQFAPDTEAAVFTYFAAPHVAGTDRRHDPRLIVLSVSPTSGPDAGSTNVTLTGGPFDGGSDYRCRFGPTMVPATAAADGRALHCQAPEAVQPSSPFVAAMRSAAETGSRPGWSFRDFRELREDGVVEVWVGPSGSVEGTPPTPDVLTLRAIIAAMLGEEAVDGAVELNVIDYKEAKFEATWHPNHALLWRVLRAARPDAPAPETLLSKTFRAYHREGLSVWMRISTDESWSWAAPGAPRVALAVPRDRRHVGRGVDRFLLRPIWVCVSTVACGHATT